MDDRAMLNAREAAEAVGVHPNTFGRYLKQGRVRGARRQWNGTWLVPAPVEVEGLPHGKIGYRVAAQRLGVARHVTEHVFRRGGVPLEVEDGRTTEAALHVFAQRVRALAAALEQGQQDWPKEGA